MGDAEALDPRINAFRPELADVRLKGRVEAQSFAEGTLKRVAVSQAPLKRSPLVAAPMDSEVVLGEVVRVFGDTSDGWSFCQCAFDSYVGFIPTQVLGDMEPEPTHRVTAPRTFLYPSPDLKLPPRATLVAGSRIAVDGQATTRGTVYRLLRGGDGAVVDVDVEPLETPLASDFVAVAERFINTPYLWGGRTSRGVDCSGFVQLVLSLTGRSVPRDTDLQAKTIGDPVADGLDGTLERGDIVIWPGHALIIRDRDTVIHSSGHHMRVVVEPTGEAFRRLLKVVGQPSGVRRLVPGPASSAA
ncbi:MAG: C40 family peptidase [Bauldia sp.]|uniref:C40 family peptidase n=1 Tax=Bauldia sp. TaxID=2575872 RepID=UPI001D4C365C|nr:NlpC/P60 family protein [Bauldia sp.]MCB1494471.1 C40 family peptidase [Bauldia sp.]